MKIVVVNAGKKNFYFLFDESKMSPSEAQKRAYERVWGTDASLEDETLKTYTRVEELREL